MEQSVADTELLRRGRHFVAEEVGTTFDRALPGARIEDDLGATGDDAGDLMVAFAKELQIDLRGFDFRRHFGPEGWDLFGLLSHQDYGRFPITVRHLAEVAAHRAWCEPFRC